MEGMALWKCHDAAKLTTGTWLATISTECWTRQAFGLIQQGPSYDLTSCFLKSLKLSSLFPKIHTCHFHSLAKLSFLPFPLVLYPCFMACCFPCAICALPQPSPDLGNSCSMFPLSLFVRVKLSLIVQLHQSPYVPFQVACCLNSERLLQRL